MGRHTIVISAFPATGKTTICRHGGGRLGSAYVEGIVMLDSDSSKYGWFDDGLGNKVRDPDFPANYIEHIKSAIGRVDVIFVSSHLQVREALEAAGIRYYTVYPAKGMRAEWVGRSYLRGDPPQMTKFIADNFDEFVEDIDAEPHGQRVIRLGPMCYIDAALIRYIDRIDREG